MGQKQDARTREREVIWRESFGDKSRDGSGKVISYASFE